MIDERLYEGERVLHAGFRREKFLLEVEQWDLFSQVAAHFVHKVPSVNVCHRCFQAMEVFSGQLA